MFWNMFYEICQKKNISPSAVAKIIGVSNSTTTKWKSGAIPNGEILIKLADYFQVSTDYLLGREPVTNKIENNNLTVSGIGASANNNFNVNGSDGAELNQIEKTIVEKMKTMTETEKAKLLLTACEIVERNSND